MRAARNYKPASSLSSFPVALVALPLLVLLLIFLIQPLNTSLSSSSSSETWIVGNSSSGNFSDSHSLSSAQEWPQPPAEAPLTSFLLYGTPNPAPAPQISTTGVKVGGNRRVKSWRSRKLDKLEASLGSARSSIREAALTSLVLVRNKKNSTTSQTVEVEHDEDPDYVPRGRIYRNSHAFHRSYLLMEKLFKIYVYEEGEMPLFHSGPCISIYSSEGRFIHEMERGNFYRTKDPDEAHVYFLPVSVTNLVQYLYVPVLEDYWDPMKRAIVDYVNVIAGRHPFWNRSLGADHFMLSCHDWGPVTSSFVPQLFHKSIRVFCNANTSEGFNPSKDASFPEINLRTTEVPPLGGDRPSTRTLLAFFAGRRSTWPHQVPPSKRMER